jgi:two-component system response regulator HydG
VLERPPPRFENGAQMERGGEQRAHGRVLVVDDVPEVRDVLREALAAAGFGVLEARDGLEALATVERAGVDLVLCDLEMPRLDGLGVLRRLAPIGVPTLIFSAHGELDAAVEAMRAGARDFLALHADAGELVARVARQLEAAPRTARARALVGRHPSMVELRERIRRVAGRDASVLITGESGVGKELVAREVHAASRRARGPFVAVSCCALSEGLLESELFGHERGAFTGAIARLAGRFERAHGGTLFLDEIGEAPPGVQARLLRALQEREFERVGGTETVRVDVRVVAATNRDLGRLREEGRFRDDLFHRLNVFPLHVPPLRERRSDIAVLARELAARHRLALEWTDAASARLAAHDWPGNVRELENAIERLGILCEDASAVTLERVEQALDPAGVDGAGARAAFEEGERGRYEELLRRHRWNVSAVARALGLSRGALRHRMRKHGL